ncbi:MAG: hypothetical protein JST00_13895 [Deltaproteobacteria bacterium]|nr:hypothetical protein [Deltaproteobacteria bacterium]
MVRLDASRLRRIGMVRHAALALAAFVTVTVVLVRPAPAEADDAGVKPPAPAASTAGSSPPANVTPADIEDVEHMCALLTACDRLPLPSGLVPPSFAACTRALYTELASPSAASFSLTLRDCGLRASSCGELRACALRGAKPDVCAGRGKGGTSVDLCDGDGRAVSCTNERVALVRDCPRGGEQCVVRDGKAVCALGACEKDGPATCSNSGTRVLECKKGKLVSLDCGAFGLRCVNGPSGPTCGTSGAACSEGASRCEGATSVACWHGHEVRVDCGARGLGCAGSADAGATSAVGACVQTPPASGACDPERTGPKCDGANIRYCSFGTPRVYLCKSVGLSRCVSDDKGVRCAP